MTKKTCVIVGIGPGLGFALAKKFGQEGYQIAMLARRAEALEKYAQDLKKLGVDAYGFKTDVSDTESIVTAFEKIRYGLGSPNVLIYNAAALRSGDPLSITANDLLQDFKVNVVGALLSVQQVIPEMHNSGGTILLTGGGFALEPYPEFTSLALGKAAIRNLSFSLAQALEKHIIHVATVTICGVIEPGTRFDPDWIAQEYWRLHTQKPKDWEKEYIYQ